MLAAGCASEPPAPPPAATFANVQAVLSRACNFSTCHGGSAMSGELRLVPGESYAMLVNTPSSQVPRLLRVRPGDPSTSWLMNKLDNTLTAVPECRGGGNPCGVSMPERGALLSATERDLFRRWIAAGAPGP